MHDIDISPDTTVRHKDGGAYSIVSITTVGDQRRAHINRAGFGTVFEGTVPQARSAGFMFGDEEWPGVIADGTIVTHTAYPDRLYGYEPLEVVGLNAERTYRILREGASISTGTVAELYGAGFRFNAPEVTVEEIEALLTPEEPEPSAMRRAWLASEEAVRRLEGERDGLSAELHQTLGVASDLRGELATANASVNSHRTSYLEASTNLADFKVAVRDQVIAAKKEHDLCADGCNAFLEELGLPPLKKRYTVTVTRDSDGETILTVSDIEADTESEARSEVRDNFTVIATVKEVRFEYEYDGEGESDFDEEDYTDDDFDVTDDEYADSHRDNLTFTVEED
jgi:hypothetical protein